MARPTRKTKRVDYIKFEKKVDKVLKKKSLSPKRKKKKALNLYKKYGA